VNGTDDRLGPVIAVITSLAQGDLHPDFPEIENDPDLQAIVVVDDADEALEDERAPTWHARDVGFERASRAGASVRVVTPVPTVDALHHLPVPARPPAGGATAGRAGWPRVEVVDPRDDQPGRGVLGTRLAEVLHATLDRGARAVCVLNRTGRARLLACVHCSELARCESCGATVAEVDGGLSCGRCGTTRPLVCLHCHGTKLRAVRSGVRRIGEELAALLPRASVAVVEGSSAEHPDVDVLVGTEAALHRAASLATGGPTSPPVGLVAFLEFDQELLAPRVHAAEAALWLLVRGARLLGGPGAGAPAPGGAAPGLLLVQTRVAA